MKLKNAVLIDENTDKEIEFGQIDCYYLGDRETEGVMVQFAIVGDQPTALQVLNPYGYIDCDRLVQDVQKDLDQSVVSAYNAGTDDDGYYWAEVMWGNVFIRFDGLLNEER